ncbi:MAG: hypothetical protein VX811_13315, partial [Pseudomonadota bacterium]|nr:hypothetical protein [Pseudomonadota bacterium]
GALQEDALRVTAGNFGCFSCFQTCGSGCGRLSAVQLSVFVKYTVPVPWRYFPHSTLRFIEKDTSIKHNTVQRY